MKSPTRLFLFLLNCFAFLSGASAAIFDIGDGDVEGLKRALIVANSNGQADTIILHTGRAYSLTAIDNFAEGANGLPVIKNDAAGLDLTIQGNGATIERNSVTPNIPQFRILQIANGGELLCTDLIVRNGKVSGSFPNGAGAGILVTHATLRVTGGDLRENNARFGGAIFNHGGAVTMAGATMTENVAAFGGGIFNNQGTIGGSASVFVQNYAQGGGNPNEVGLGGAVYNEGANGSASATFSNCTFTSNHTSPTNSSGGAIYNDGYLGSATMALTDCTFDTNFGSGGFGGAIGNDSGSLNISGTLFKRNSGIAAGAIYAFDGVVDVRSCTFELNYTDDGTNVNGFGGAMAVLGGAAARITDTTMRANKSSGGGAAIYNQGTTTIANCGVNENVSKGSGGAIMNEAQMTLLDTGLNSNSAIGFGGGIYNIKSLVTQRCNINGNTSGGGGGIFNSGVVQVDGCTFDNNKSTAFGGGITSFSAVGSSMVLLGSTFSNNTAQRGGGISNFGSALILRNCTVSGNTGTIQGGGLHNLGGNSDVRNVTFYGNSSPSGGGAFNQNTAGTQSLLKIQNTIFQTGANGANLAKPDGSIVSLGNNLSNDPAGGDGGTAPGGFLNAANDLRNTNTLLSPLQNNGGPTLTHLPLVNSPAIDGGNNFVLETAIGLTSDQRGQNFPRRLGAHVDRGAVEIGSIFVVTTTDDHNDGVCSVSDCTLREAITAANAAGPANISFLPNVNGTIQLGAALPNLSSSLFLNGPGANLLTVRRNTGGDYRVFVLSNGTTNGPSATIKGLTITNGRAPSDVYPNNSGGGLFSFYGSLALEQCAVVGNSAAVSDTSAGGGILNFQGNLSVKESTIAGNSAHTGGGIASSIVTGVQRVAYLRASTISGNTVQGGEGGGIFSEASDTGSVSDVLLENCTVSGNSASTSGLFGGSGGGIFNQGKNSAEARLALEDCTIANNSAPNTGGVYNNNFGGTASVNLHNTLLKNGASGGNLLNSSGQINSLGYNLCDDAAGGLSGSGPGGYLNATGDLRETDPLLGPLQSNGGLTATHALLPGSPAINAGEDSNANATDQRGRLRSGNNDIGAFEFSGVDLRITNIERVGVDLVISFSAAANFTYSLARKESLPNSAWSSVVGVDQITPGSDGIAKFTDPAAAILGQSFYRVQTQLP